MKSSKLCKPAPFLLVALCVAIAGCGSSGYARTATS
jgi:general secretion pathway protein D